MLPCVVLKLLYKHLRARALLRYSDRLGFRERSETAEIAIELSLQPWRAFRPDGVIMFSDILTPLPALGIEFDVVRGKGPVIAAPVRRHAAHTDACARALLSLLAPSTQQPLAVSLRLAPPAHQPLAVSLRACTHLTCCAKGLA